MGIDIYGDRVRSARILRGIKSGELASEMGWPPPRQTKLEQSDITQVEDAKSARLSQVLRFPNLYFTTAPAPAISVNELLFRAPASITKTEKSYLAEFARAVGEFLEWIDGYHRLPPVRLPILPPGTQVDQAAMQVREALGVDSTEPIRNLTHRLERAGVAVIVRRWETESGMVSADPSPREKHIGYSTRVGKHRDRPISVLRALDSWERTRWTVSHEIGHHVLHGSRLPADAEGEASQFASELLAPAACLREQMPRHVTLASLTEVKLHWGISIGALIPHAFANGLISQERHDTLRSQLYSRINPATGRTWGRDEPGWDTQVVERPSMLTTWLERCIGGTAPNLIATASRIWPADIAALITGVASHGKIRPPETRHAVGRIGHAPSRNSDVIDLNTWRTREEA